MSIKPAVARTSENATTAGLGVILVGGVYVDGWAHLNVGSPETFFTPWHGVLYGGFSLLVVWLAWMVWRRRRSQNRWVGLVPLGYGWGWVGVALFAAGGVGDMLWHLAFGIEAGLDALVSPTHLLLLTGGTLLLTSPLRAAAATGRDRWPAVVSMAAATSLAGFFLSYVSVFADPGAREPLRNLPADLPEHRAAELPVIAGLAGYVVCTVLLIGPVLYLRRRRLLPPGSIAVLAGAVAIPAVSLSHLVFIIPAIAALAGAGLVDLILTIRPNLPDALLASLVPASMWTGQLLGLASSGELRWPPQLWAGVVVLTALLAATLTWLLAPAEPAVVMSDPGQQAHRRGRKLSSIKSPQQRVTQAQTGTVHRSTTESERSGTHVTR
jgi:hypothetical protein